MRAWRATLRLLLVSVAGLAGAGALCAQTFTYNEARGVLNTYCKSCHQGKTPPGRFDADAVAAPGTDIRVWNRILSRVRDGSMPPKGSPALSVDQREQFSGWLDGALRAAVCASGPVPGPAPIRRLNRSQYTATIRHLLNVDMHAGRALPEDGAGGEGFDNAAETLFLSPLLAEKYLEAAKEALNVTFKNPKTKGAILIERPGPGVTAEQAARKAFAGFLPRAFRRPAAAADIESYMALFRAAQKRGESFDGAMLLALQGVLMSPHFLFRVEEPNPEAAPRLAGDYELASRLSYFLWNSMPDQELFDLAAAGKLRDPAVLEQQALRMLTGDVRGIDDAVRITHENKLDAMAQQFIEQWLETRELGRDIKPDIAQFPEYYQTDLNPAIHYQPVMFFKELLTRNLSLLNFLDSKFTMLNTPLTKLYGLNLKAQQRVSAVGAQLSAIDLPEGSDRGGLLGMSAVLAVSSYPNRTSPVLRGKWILEALLGSPPPPPPASVPALEENQAGAPPKTARERLQQHRQNSACASCHNRIDPLGFGLENYDVLGRWRTHDSGIPIDAKGELPDGTQFEGPAGLKKALLDRKDQFIRHLTGKMLGYALGRGLTLEDSCTVDHIVAKLKENDYAAQTLIREIVLSAPFRYRPGGEAKPIPQTGGGR